MLYLLWAILNIDLFLFFIVVCFRATKLLREKFGVFIAVIFVFGLLSFVNNSNNDEEDKGLDSGGNRKWEFATTDSLDGNSISHLKIVLEKNLISSYELLIVHGKDKQWQLNTPIRANSWMVGFTSGIGWKPSVIMVSKTDDNNRFQYYVDGTVEWKLMGKLFYSQNKIFKGIATVK